MFRYRGEFFSLWRKNHPKVIYRSPRGKYDAINYGVKFMPGDVDVVFFNDVDTIIVSFEPLLEYFRDDKVAMVYTLEYVSYSPQHFFSIYLTP